MARQKTGELASGLCGFLSSLLGRMFELLIKQARDDFDLTEPSHQQSVIKLADDFIEAGNDEVLRALLQGAGVLLEARMAGLLAKSKMCLFSSGVDPYAKTLSTPTLLASPRRSPVPKALRRSSILYLTM